MEYVHLGKHVICSSPVDITVQRDLQCLREFTLNLNTLKVLYHFDRSFTSRIRRPHELNQFGFRHASQGPVNILKIRIAGIKKNLGALRQFYEQFGQKIRSVTHHHWS